MFGVIGEGSEESDGVLGDPNRPIEATDMLMFISSCSTPQIDTKPVCIREAANVTLASENHQTEVANAREMVTEMVMRSAEERRVPILVCGWRRVWEVDPSRLKDRMKEIAHGSGSDGSGTHRIKIIFMNLLSTRDFKEHLMSFRKQRPSGEYDLNSVEDSELGGHWVLEGSVHSKVYNIQIFHLQGDAVAEKDLRKALEFELYDAAIILGTQAGIELPAKLQDRRILTICMMIRYVLSRPRQEKRLQWQQHNMRIVSENYQDQTALLAVSPFERSESRPQRENDFINTQVPLLRPPD